ncbi:MAG: SDR family NAD(P)-dependent oxidoreductase [Chloroflexota bacterium]|nr:SDR family NAD(P)-dependent oxidoreductase [Chloroflexota bacterium]
MPEKRPHFSAPLVATGGIGCVLLVQTLLRRRKEDFTGKVALVTGGSRGLGLQLAREFARVGCRIAICARDEDELRRAADDLRSEGAIVFSLHCDVSNRDDMEHTILAVTDHFGCVDILVNNAGIIQAGPIETMAVEDFEKAMGIIFWGTLYATLAVLPQMRARRSGHIVNITSVGGKISMPHLLPYGAAKFATTGFSEGLRAELASDGVHVTTIAPGLLRTGGQRNAEFTGNQEAEYAWFSLGDTLPFAALDVAQAAREIVAATQRGQAERILSLPASVVARLSGAFPALSTDILALVNRFILPSRNGGSSTATPGTVVHEREPAALRTVVDGAEGAADARLNQPPHAG